MADVKIGNKIYTGVNSIKLNTVDGGTVTFAPAITDRFIYTDNVPEDTSKIWVKTKRTPERISKTKIKGEVINFTVPDNMMSSNTSNSVKVISASRDDINGAIFYAYCYSRHTDAGYARVAILQINADGTTKLLATPVDETFEYHNKYTIMSGYDTAETLYILLGYSTSTTSGNLMQSPQYLWAFDKKTNAFGQQLLVSAANYTSGTNGLQVAVVGENVLVYGRYRQTSSDTWHYAIYRTNRALTDTVTVTYTDDYNSGDVGFVYDGKLYTTHSAASGQPYCIFDETGVLVDTWRTSIADNVDDVNFVYDNLVLSTNGGTGVFRALDMTTEECMYMRGEYSGSGAYSYYYVYAIHATDEYIYVYNSSQTIRKYPRKSAERNIMYIAEYQPKPDYVYFSDDLNTQIDVTPIGGAYIVDNDGYFKQVLLLHYVDNAWVPFV